MLWQKRRRENTLMKRWFFLWMAAVLIAGAVSYSASHSARPLTSLPDPRSDAYKGHDDIQTLIYVRDVAGQLQRENQLILDTLDELQMKIEKLERKIEESKSQR